MTALPRGTSKASCWRDESLHSETNSAETVPSHNLRTCTYISDRDLAVQQSLSGALCQQFFVCLIHDRPRRQKVLRRSATPVQTGFALQDA